jgi:hypothetical protein
MPFLHRLATFRDDIIFFIYLYQRWAYKVDYTRVNEFGQGGDDEEPAAQGQDKKEKEAIEGQKKADTKPQGKTTGADAGRATKRK